ncbi:MAG: FAD-dependent oxidoreductase [Phycisphaerae bacterium]|nr:FAD-dependent oxidoreductase [Phycisphaerae bacterium]
MSIVQHHELSCDVLIAGGGSAGVPCAVAAARLGKRVILCQDRPVLGGNASSEIRMHICGADASGARSEPLAVEAREGGIIEEIRLEACVRNPQRSASMLDLIFYELCRAEPNLTVMFNTTIVGVETDGSRITHVRADRQSTEDAFRIAAKVFVDCTGDGRLGLEAGAPYREGREDKNEYGESLAQARADNKRLCSTLLFTARKHDRPVPFVPPPWARTFTQEHLEFRDHATSQVDYGLEYGYWWVETGGLIDTVKDNEKIRDDLLAILLGVWDHIKNGGDHGAENWALDWFGFLPGKRESRRFIGRHVLSQSDLMESRPFEDAIAYGGWTMDLHVPEGVDAPDRAPTVFNSVPHLYEIPLRSCVSRDVSNLMFAGRNLSASHVAFGSTRLMATCAAVGQGVGVAAAYAVDHDRAPHEFVADPRAMRAVQRRLLRDDAYLIGRLGDDGDDLARRAEIVASSEQTLGPARNVVSGQTRAVHGDKGAPPDRANPGTHRWMSDPSERLPAWIELSWDKPVRLGEIQLIFDTGLHRVLTLSHSDAYVAKMVWGRPQPETVRDYVVLGFVGGAWREIAAVTGNYQRRRLHRPSGAPEAHALRIEVRSTNGLDHARICEVRVYDDSHGRWSSTV